MKHKIGYILGSIPALFTLALILIIGCVYWVCTGCKRTVKGHMYGEEQA